MKLLLVFAAVILAVNALSDEELWTEFKQAQDKTYKSLREEKLRFDIFKNTLKTIKEHNAKYENGEETWFMGINQFSDLTDEEFKAQYLSYKPIEFESLGVENFNLSVPNSIDWRSKGAVLSVKNQGQCGSCWAFSAVGAIEGQNAIKHHIKADLSEQELLDCSHQNPNRGCHGGNPSVALLYVEHKGIATLRDYPYKGSPGSCHGGKNSAKVKVTGVRAVASNENALKQAVASVGPISVGIASEKIRHYGGGIFNNPSCGKNLDHAVLVVGYGSAHNQDFWIVKNSWSSSWGERGFIRMARNKSNQCGIASMASFPVLR